MSAKTGQQNETANFGQSLIVVPNVQHFVDEVPVQGFGITFVFEDLEKDMRRGAGPVMSQEHRAAQNIGAAKARRRGRVDIFGGRTR